MKYILEKNQNKTLIYLTKLIILENIARFFGIEVPAEF